jgi:hypothetical protein
MCFISRRNQFFPNRENKMGPNPFMEMLWMVHALKQNKDMVAYLETIKEMTLKRARMP